jgi:hypothetical protein
MRCNLKDEGMMEIFMLYVDVFLPKIAMSECWSREQRLNTTISEAKLANGKAAAPPQTEAYLLAVWANGYHRWKYIAEKQKKEEAQDRNCIDYQVPFSSDKQGQARWGGWNQAGIDFYKEASQLCKEGREKPDCAAFEKEVLKRLRKKHRVVDLATKRAANKRVVVQQEKEETDVEENELDDFE